MNKFSRHKVVSFEAVPELAKIARDTIARSDAFEFNVLWRMHTSELDNDFFTLQYGSKAQCVVSELLDTLLLGEGLVEGMRHAKTKLLNPVNTGAQVIPRYSAVYIQV